MAGSFGDLLKQAGLAGTAPPDEPAARVAEPEDAAIHYGSKVIVRKERKGHGGRTITRVSGVLSGHDELARLLKKQLGVGVRAEDETLILQGDQRERVARWLESQGAKVVRA